jgi:hypothetical protein
METTTTLDGHRSSRSEETASPERVGADDESNGVEAPGRGVPDKPLSLVGVTFNPAK